MANREHLILLRKGTKAWNEWRKRYPAIRPDLDNADLRFANLMGANLIQINLFGVDLSDALDKGIGMRRS